MRAALLALAACTYVPEPQPPRTVCNGTVVASSNVALMNSTCQEIPADPCYDDDSEECADEADRRREHNATVHRNRVVAGVVSVIAIVLMLGYASTN